jgi:hypothetical protein
MVRIIFITACFEWWVWTVSCHAQTPSSTPRIINSVEWVTNRSPPTHTHTLNNSCWPFNTHDDPWKALWMNSLTYKAIKGRDFGTLLDLQGSLYPLLASYSWFISAFRCLWVTLNKQRQGRVGFRLEAFSRTQTRNVAAYRGTRAEMQIFKSV